MEETKEIQFELDLLYYDLLNVLGYFHLLELAFENREQSLDSYELELIYRSISFTNDSFKIILEKIYGIIG